MDSRVKSHRDTKVDSLAFSCLKTAISLHEEIVKDPINPLLWLNAINSAANETNDLRISTIIHKGEVLERARILLSNLSSSCIAASKIISGSIADYSAPVTIFSLPDELLEHIFCYAVAEDDFDTEIPTSITHTCSRFRTVALDTPHLWARVSNKQGPDERTTFLTRRRRAGLTVVITYEDKDSTIQAIEQAIVQTNNFLETVIPSSDEWIRIIIDFSYRSVNEHFQSHIIGRTLYKCRDLNLSLLADLTLRSTRESRNTDLLLQTLLSTWKMPVLRRLKLHNNLPPYAFPETLGDLTIIFDEDFPFRSDQLLRFLSMNTTILHLSLDYVHCTVKLPGDILPVHLKSLRSLNISCPPKMSIRYMLPKLHLPVIEKLSFTFFLTPGLAITRGLMEDLLPVHNTFSALTEFAFNIRQYEPIDENPLAFMAYKFPNLQHLSVGATNCWPPDGDGLGRSIPHLKSLNLKNCPHFDKYFMRKLGHALRSSGRLLDTLSVSECPHLSKDWLKSVFPSKYIVDA